MIRLSIKSINLVGNILNIYLTKTKPFVGYITPLLFMLSKIIFAASFF